MNYPWLSPQFREYSQSAFFVTQITPLLRSRPIGFLVRRTKLSQKPDHSIIESVQIPWVLACVDVNTLPCDPLQCDLQVFQSALRIATLPLSWPGADRVAAMLVANQVDADLEAYAIPWHRGASWRPDAWLGQARHPSPSSRAALLAFARRTNPWPIKRTVFGVNRQDILRKEHDEACAAPAAPLSWRVAALWTAARLRLSSAERIQQVRHQCFTPFSSPQDRACALDNWYDWMATEGLPLLNR